MTRPEVSKAAGEISRTAPATSVPIVIVLRNALRCSPGESRVEVTAASGGAEAGIAVAAKAMRLHGRTIRSANRPGGGLVATCNHSAGAGLDGARVTAPEWGPAAPGR